MGVCKWRNRQSAKLSKEYEKLVEILAISNAICAEDKEESKSLNGKSEVSVIAE